MKMMKAAVALGMALTMTVTGASAVFAEGETLSVATDFEVKTLVPWAASEENAFMVLNQAEEGLFRMDENNQPQPALCDTYEVTDDKLTYTFHLRDGIQWSNGEPVTAADFVYAWLKQMSTDATNGYSLIMQTVYYRYYCCTCNWNRNYDRMPQNVQGKKISDKGRSCDCNGSCSRCLREYDLFWTNGYVDWTGKGKWNFKR